MARRPPAAQAARYSPTDSYGTIPRLACQDRDRGWWIRAWISARSVPRRPTSGRTSPPKGIWHKSGQHEARSSRDDYAGPSVSRTWAEREPSCGAERRPDNSRGQASSRAACGPLPSRALSHLHLPSVRTPPGRADAEFHVVIASACARPTPGPRCGDLLDERGLGPGGQGGALVIETVATDSGPGVT